MFSKLVTVVAGATLAQAFWLMAMENTLTTQRLDPIVSAGKVSGHTHSIHGGSKFGITTNTSYLRQSKCTTTPIVEDKSAYWYPTVYFQWANGSFSHLEGNPVVYYLFDKTVKTKAFPDDFRMLSGDPTLRTRDNSSPAQQAITFKCLNFQGAATDYVRFPPMGACPSGVRAQVTFPSCWDGKNADSADHKSHVAFKSLGPDNGTCSDPKFPVTLPRVFLEVYLDTHQFDQHKSQAKNPDQPFVFSMGDPTGFGFHADYMYGWDKGVLQKAVDGCTCNDSGDPQCCANKGIFTLKPSGSQTCFVTNKVNEQTTGTLHKLPGNNPVQPEGKKAKVYESPNQPPLFDHVYVYGKNVKNAPVTPPNHAQTSSKRDGDVKPRLTKHRRGTLGKRY